MLSQYLRIKLFSKKSKTITKIKNQNVFDRAVIISGALMMTLRLTFLHFF